MAEPRQFSEDGIEMHIQVNHVATSLLTLLLLPSMLKANAARIVNVNSLVTVVSQIKKIVLEL